MVFEMHSVTIKFQSICELKVSGAESHYFCNFYVIYALASLKWNQEPRDVTVKEGQDVTVACSAKGYPKPTVAWSKLGSIEDVSMYDNNLHMFSTSSKDAGQYECVAKNSAGEKLSKIISVSVIGKD